MSVWALFFGWPTGQVWPNVVAAGLTGGLPAVAAIVWSHRRHQRRADERHAELIDHVTNSVAATPDDGSTTP